MRAKILTLLAFLPLAGCSSVPSLLYKIEIQQGNVITQDMVDKLKPGMTRSQVRFVLGSPMVSDIFHSHRWDYVYRLEQRGRLVEQRQLTVFFENDEVARLDGSFAPSAAFGSSGVVADEAGAAPVAGVAAGSVAPLPEEPDGEGPILSALPPDGALPPGGAAPLSRAPALPALQPVVPRQVPLRAVDPGNAEADLPKD